MATPINAPLAGEIWHLSIEDLFQPVQEAPRLGGDGPFVINLSVSTAPISVPAKPLTGHSAAHVYQIQVTEDGRPRFRLRLGPFATEDEADAILAEVRETYPGALTATASGSDLRVIAGLQAKVEHRQTAAQKPQIDKPPAHKALDAEISIDIAWPTPELAVPLNAPPPRTAAPAPAPAPVAPPVTAKAVGIPVAAAPAPNWALPELDIQLAAAARPMAPAPLAARPAPPPKPTASSFDAPLALVNDAPLLTEVVVPAKKAARNTPAAGAFAPTLTDAVAPKIKTPVAPAAAAKRFTPPPAVSAPAPKMAPKIMAPVAAPAPAAIAPTAVAPAAVPKNAPFAPRAPVPSVLTQSVAPRNAAGYKARGGISKPLAANRLTSLQHVVVATAPAPAPREVKKLEEPLESLESTQTIRALTPKELEDNDSRWFVIQLSLADHAFDPDSVPNLDIFSEYRLYSVAGLDQGRVVHALRLGFFREEIAAVAVASYLAAYWDKPSIKRVSVAERERFADQRVDARKDVGATGKHSVIEITDELVARRRRSSKAAAAHTPPQPPLEH